MRQVVILSATGASTCKWPAASVTLSGSQSMVSGKYWRRRGGVCWGDDVLTALLTGPGSVVGAGWAAPKFSTTAPPPAPPSISSRWLEKTEPMLGVNVGKTTMAMD